MGKIKISVCGELDKDFWAILPVIAIGKRQEHNVAPYPTQYYLTLGWLCGMVTIYVESIEKDKE